ncbi:MAG: hypothetical protein NUV77_25455 [Thermoguttaceae bacterium]|jgi:hypothetical protein|nr:hypothetical protein [Thermoguttaceae bacterium]
MTLYQIIETDAGLTVSELQPNTLPEVAAERAGGVVVDPGPYSTYEDAYDAMLALAVEEEEDEL